MRKDFTWDDLTFWQTGEWQAICERLDILDAKGVPYCPRREDMFKALEFTPFEKVKVVVFGQDPYPDQRHAMGLAFSVPNSIKKLPRSLKNIFVEYEKDLGIKAPRRDDGTIQGDLSSWAYQGVFLFNSIPTCFEGRPLSHENWWEWNDFTNEVMMKLNEKKPGIVFMFWGSRGHQEWAPKLDERHKIIKCAHPSPRAASRGWFGSRPFTTCNTMLRELDHEPIEWDLRRGKEFKPELVKILEGVFDINPKTPEYIYAEETSERTDTDGIRS